MREKRRNLYTHTQLRHCLAFLLFAVIPYNSFATTACVSNDTVAVVLDAYGTVVSYSPLEESALGGYQWSAEFDNGVVVKGVSACLTSANGLGQFDIYTANNGILIDNNQVVVGGELNGTNCVCKMTYPIMSLWIQRDEHSSGTVSRCATYCAAWCGKFFWKDNRNLHYGYRQKLFESVQN